MGQRHLDICIVGAGMSGIRLADFELEAAV